MQTTIQPEKLEHLRYEAWMLQSTAGLLASKAFGEGPVSNALLESFLIHARNLLDFLYPPGNSRADDMLATDFVPKEKWESVRPPKTQLMIDIERPLDKQVAHLTYSRFTGDAKEKQWAVVKIANDIGGVFNLFVDTAGKQSTGFQAVRLEFAAEPEEFYGTSTITKVLTVESFRSNLPTKAVVYVPPKLHKTE